MKKNMSHSRRPQVARTELRLNQGHLRSALYIGENLTCNILIMITH